MIPPTATSVAAGEFTTAMSADPWSLRLRQWALHESQIRGSIEAHRAALPESVRVRYGSLVSLSERRLRALEAALRVRGEKNSNAWVSLVRSLGRMTGALTAWAGARRILSMDIDGVRGLEASYFEASQEKPPRDIACMLTGFIGELEFHRAALVEEAKPLFGK